MRHWGQYFRMIIRIMIFILSIDRLYYYDYILVFIFLSWSIIPKSNLINNQKYCWYFQSNLFLEILIIYNRTAVTKTNWIFFYLLIFYFNLVNIILNLLNCNYHYHNLFFIRYSLFAELSYSSILDSNHYKYFFNYY
jgi:hypothetical protein